MRWPRSPTAAALELESSAPPMDLDRPHSSSAQPLDLSHPSSTPSHPAPGPASPGSLAELAHSSGSAVKVGQQDGIESANADSAAEAEPAVAAESALKGGSANDTSASVDKPVQHRTDDKPQMVISPQENPTQAVAGNVSGVTAISSTEQSSDAAVERGKRQVLGAGDNLVTGGEGQGEGQAIGGDGGDMRQVVGGGDSDAEASQIGDVVPSTEEALDSAMQELAQEVRYVCIK